MTPLIRLRRHTDGRAAINRAGDLWCVPFGREMTIYPSAYVSGPGWSELLVAELPEPDDAVSGTKVWDLGFGKLIVGGRAEFESSFPYSIDNVDQLRSDALKMLAAVAACEQYRAQREATT
jgi:hypothetical protein